MINVYMDDVRTGPFNDSCFSENDWQDWIIVRSVKNTKLLLFLGQVNELSLDHVMGEQETGSNLVHWMIEANIWPQGKITIHSANYGKALEMKADIERHAPEKCK